MFVGLKPQRHSAARVKGTVLGSYGSCWAQKTLRGETTWGRVSKREALWREVLVCPSRSPGENSMGGVTSGTHEPI